MAEALSLDRLLRVEEVEKITGLSSSTLYKWQAEDKFPRAVLLGARAVRWVQSEVAAWIEQQRTEGQRATLRRLPAPEEEMADEPQSKPQRRGRGRPRSQQRLHPD